MTKKKQASYYSESRVHAARLALIAAQKPERLDSAAEFLKHAATYQGEDRDEAVSDAICDLEMFIGDLQKLITNLNEKEA